MDGRRPADRLGPDLREPDLAHVAGLDQLRDCADGLLDRHLRIKPRRTIDVDMLDTEPHERVGQRCLEPRGTRVKADERTVGTAPPPELDTQQVVLTGPPAERFGDQQLVVAS